jgi:hypothetical protein
MERESFLAASLMRVYWDVGKAKAIFFLGSLLVSVIWFGFNKYGI